MFSFIGWEAVPSLTHRLRSPERDLPRVILGAFAVTTVIYLGLAVTTVGVLGATRHTDVPLADLLRTAIGAAGPAVAAVAALALTLAAVNAYVTGAGALAEQLVGSSARSPRRTLRLLIAVLGVITLGADAAGWVDTGVVLAVPTALFTTVYVACTAAAAVLFRGPRRVLAAATCLVVAAVLGFSGWALIAVALVCAISWIASGQVRAKPVLAAAHHRVPVRAQHGTAGPAGGADEHVADVHLLVEDGPAAAAVRRCERPTAPADQPSGEICA